MAIRYPNTEARKEAARKIEKAVHQMIYIRDWDFLERIWSRLSWQSLDEHMRTAFDLAIDEAKDVEIMHAVQFVEHGAAMSECGRSWRG